MGTRGRWKRWGKQGGPFQDGQRQRWGRAWPGPQTLNPSVAVSNHSLNAPVSHFGTSAVLSGAPTFPLVSNMPTAMRACAPWLATETMPRAFMVLQMPASSPLRQRRGRDGGGQGREGEGREGERGPVKHWFEGCGEFSPPGPHGASERASLHPNTPSALRPSSRHSPSPSNSTLVGGLQQTARWLVSTAYRPPTPTPPPITHLLMACTSPANPRRSVLGSCLLCP